MEDGIADGEPHVDDVEIETITKRCRLPRRQAVQAVQSKKICAKEERNASIKKVSTILQKLETDRTAEEERVLLECSDAVEEVQERWRRRDEAKRRLEEFEDPEEVLNDKCRMLAQAIAQSQHLVVYTGAGISTAAKIPDYRGPNGIWTRLQKGKEIGQHDLSLAEPTYTHMALSELYRKNKLKYVVSQNCDGLHLRSGLPRTALSELHGNMYIEVCKKCKPHKEYWRLFDVTENTARYSHKTLRRCYACNDPLVDSIVHFGERGSLQWPLNWSGACKNANTATTIVCLGSSLKVLKRYPWLWQMDKPAKKRPNLYIVNLQWTPKDDFANVKINGKCDEVVARVMELLGIVVPEYDKYRDPIFTHATELHESEAHTTTQPALKWDPSENLKVQKEEPNDKDCIMDTIDLSSNKSETAKKLAVDNCDTSNKGESLPAKKSDPFSIDSLLQPDRPANVAAPLPHAGLSNLLNTVFTPTLPLLSYDFLQQQMLGAYSDFFLYPYQTSLLYSGLHSIIDPMPVFQEEDLFVKRDVVKAERARPACDFCDRHFNSVSCLFYPKTEAVFVRPRIRFSKVEGRDKVNMCVCCDYSTDEEDSGCDREGGSERKIQAGWFGKGYKKGRRAKKKSQV